jgi:hypothetical protein
MCSTEFDLENVLFRYLFPIFYYYYHCKMEMIYKQNISHSSLLYMYAYKTNPWISKNIYV